MVSGVTPPGSGYPTAPTPPSGDESRPSESDNQILAQMQKYLDEFREYMGDPPKIPRQTVKLLELLPKLKEFLNDNYDNIKRILLEHDYPLNGPFSINAEFDTAIREITIFEKDPHASVDLLNEAITQLNFYLHHHNIGPHA